eukprot:6197267-Pleurochrysis_carterae.AAC.3
MSADRQAASNFEPLKSSFEEKTGLYLLFLFCLFVFSYTMPASIALASFLNFCELIFKTLVAIVAKNAFRLSQSKVRLQSLKEVRRFHLRHIGGALIPSFVNTMHAARLTYLYRQSRAGFDLGASLDARAPSRQLHARSKFRHSCKEKAAELASGLQIRLSGSERMWMADSWKRHDYKPGHVSREL